MSPLPLPRTRTYIPTINCENWSRLVVNNETANTANARSPLFNQVESINRHLRPVHRDPGHTKDNRSRSAV